MATNTENQNGDIVIGEFDKNARERVRVSLTEYRGVELLDLRAYYEDSDGVRKPGKGLAIRREQLSDLKALILAAERCIEGDTTGAMTTE